MKRGEARCQRNLGVSGPRQALRYCALVVSRACLHLALSFSAIVTTSCADQLDIPPAPNFSDVLEAYVDPSAEVSSAVMESVGDQLLDLREQLLNSEIFDEILDVIVRVQVDIHENTDESGNLAIGGLGTFPNPNAVIELDHSCAGWDPDAANTEPETSGSIELTMVLELGDISPVVWGEATQCQFLTSSGDVALRSSYDGDIALYFGEEPISTGEPLRDLVITTVLSGTLGVNDLDLPVRRSFRLRGRGALEILWELDDGTEFVYLFDPDTLGQGIRDANCTGDTGCSCSLEERECTLPSGSISW